MSSKNEMTLEVLKGVASLKAGYFENAQPGTEVFFYIGSPEKWSNTYAQVQIIYADRLVKVTDHSDKKGRGIFTIGEHKNWYYSLSLFSTTEELEEKIYELLRFSLIGEVNVVEQAVNG